MVFPIKSNGKSDNPCMPCIFGASNVLGYTSSDSWKAGSPAIIKIHTNFGIGKKWIWKTNNLSQERPREPIIYRILFLFLAHSTLKYYLFKSILHICVYNPSTFLYAMYIIYCILIRNESQTVEWCDIRIRDTWSTYYTTQHIYSILLPSIGFLQCTTFKIVTKNRFGRGNYNSKVTVIYS